jgi:peptidoglycan-associated lipoprotein
VVNEYYPEALLTVEGFTDPVGSTEYNLRLGLERAETIRGYLIESGEFAQSHVRAVSYGEDSNRLVLPGRGGETEGWQNRRVVLVVEHLGSLEDATLVAGTP